MSNQRVTKVSRTFKYTATYLNGVLTVTSATDHYLATGDLVELIGTKSSLPLVSDVTVSSATQFTVPVGVDQSDRYLSGIATAFVFATGQTGRHRISLSRSSGAAAVFQSFVTGTGGAVYDLDVSLDGIHWSTIATITHTGSDGNTQFQTIAPSWVYASINIASIGAATKLQVLYSV